MPSSDPRSKKDWQVTTAAFSRFLNWLDEGVDSNGEKYLDMRRRLVSYFDRKGAAPPDELADETLNRVARRLDEEGALVDGPPARYCYIVARFVFLESLRQPNPSQATIEPVAPAADETGDERERWLECLDRCLQRLDRDDRDLILEYYRGDQGTRSALRRELASKLRVTANALTIRACRIRDKLEACVRSCAAGG